MSEFGKYTCYVCKGVFDRTRSDKEALAEAQEEYPGFEGEEMAEVCDACFKQVDPNKHWTAEELAVLWGENPVAAQYISLRQMRGDQK